MVITIYYHVARNTEAKHKDKSAIEHLGLIYRNFDKLINDPDVLCAFMKSYISIVDYRYMSC